MVALAAAIHWLLLAVTSHQLIVIVTSDWLLLLVVTRQSVEWGGHTSEEDTKQRKHEHNLVEGFFSNILIKSLNFGPSNNHTLIFSNLIQMQVWRGESFFLRGRAKPKI